jgi:U3 small nucleolar RNA-associated protein 14
MEDHHKSIKNIQADLNLNETYSNKKSQALPQKFVYYNKTSLEETELNIPKQQGDNNTIDKISFSDVLKNFDLPSMLTESSQTKLKKTLKDYTKNKEKSKVQLKFDDTETKAIERSENFKNLSKDITKYQPKVKINREADVLDFTTNQQNISFSAKSLINNSSSTKDMNDLEKTIKDVLVKNKYDTDAKIIEEENKKLMYVNPEELKKRYEELKKVKHLLFQKEIENKRKSKIKSKLYHKIKKKHKEREENQLLAQLEEVDPEGVKRFLDNKKLARIKERIELKHSFNSKFNKTVKRYNLHKDENVKEAIKENFKLRDELLKKIKGNEDGDEDDSDEDNFEAEEYEDEDLEDISDASYSENENNSEKNSVEEFDKDKLLIDFDEDENTKNNTNNNKNKNENNTTTKGVWNMKFMKNADNNLNSKLKDVLNEIDDDEEFDYSEEDDEAISGKKMKKNRKNSDDEDEDENVITNTHNPSQKNLILNSRVKNKISVSTTNINQTDPIKKDKKQKITNEVLEELNEEAKGYIKETDAKVNFNEDDLKRIVQNEQMIEDDEVFQKYLIQNDENKKEFLNEPKKSEKEFDSKIVSGWGSWAGDTKAIQAKEFLKKKRHQEIEKKKQILANTAENKGNPYVKVNNSFDKKFSNYMVKELPYGVKSQEEYEKLNNTSFGREWNSLTMYKKLIQPQVVKKIGQIIEPMKINDTTTAKKLCDIIEKATRKKQRTKPKI